MSTDAFSLSRRVAAEFLGTAFLLAVVVGSGIMGERLAGGNTAIALLANSLATGAGLIALIFTFAPISGAHFNPAVTLCMAARGAMPWRDTTPYLLAQFSGALAGVMAAHVMFDHPLYAFYAHARAGTGQWFSEFIATFGLLTIIWGGARWRAEITPITVGVYIAAAYWFTSSTAFANPAVTLARAFTDSFSGIRLIDVMPFVLAQLVALGIASTVFSWFATSPVKNDLTRAMGSPVER